MFIQKIKILKNKQLYKMFKKRSKKPVKLSQNQQNFQRTNCMNLGRFFKVIFCLEKLKELKEYNFQVKKFNQNSQRFCLFQISHISKLTRRKKK
eukprot:TRINITY_DN23653_c1_g1_i1.p2 TRINITY_DN23653_c1_g1~~TRINITY_DN23653_c1_g1_i1.p2  ORF type:complete len:101 (-),score=6.53 TRINITY_DN23653_c1_g1_i1:8-289(-)